MERSALEHVVVAGGGLAGLQTVIALRDQGYDGRLTLVGAEPHLPYDRPPLSKAVLLGDSDGSDLTFDADWDTLDVDLRLGRRATALRDGAVDTDDGPVSFDALVVATGSSPITLPGVVAAASGVAAAAPGGDTAAPGGDTGVHVLRTVEHARALRAAFTPGARVLIVGAGWIGAEAATAAARAGSKVTVVESREAPLAAAVPAEVGARTTPWYAAVGVDLRLGVQVEAVEPGALHLAGGERLAGDCILVGVGVRPETGWLASSGVRLGERGAVLVDAGLRTSVPGVYAAGDCAAWESRLFGRRVLVEHWDNALNAPATVAANVLGGSAVYDPVPYFWSEQFGRMVQYAGYHLVADRLVWRDGGPGAGWAACWLRGDRLVALLTVDRPRDLLQGRKLIASQRAVDADRLADAAVPVRSA